ncbi:hypothetical protein HMH01_04630 [Halovulum dunhuangense]|uniref:Uncharacterized protein n=1 Tax=Halovulum dunhuangense TaxID=1505036 RepID=A0A849L0D2_9RHOB|nr:hypothetical protein [Halovulum dunhuangense]NNU79722.1 hypothetical protein [Halovulum dunhuangense]
MAWPAWKTDPEAARNLPLRVIAGAALTALVALPAACFFLRSILIAVSIDTEGMARPGMARQVANLLGAMILSPAIAWAYLLAAIPVTRSMARGGRLGWAAVSLVALVLGFAATWAAAAVAGLWAGVPGASLRAGLVGAAVALPFGLFFWLMLRLLRPDAFDPRRRVDSVFE